MSNEWAVQNTITKNIDDVVPYDSNPREHAPEQIEQVANSIKEFGWTMPILIDENNEIIAGHGRLLAGKSLGIKEVPCIVAKGWSDEKKKAYCIADNKLTENSTWSKDFLKLNFEFLIDNEFDLGLTGFSNEEIAKIVPDFMIEEGLTDEDEVPEIEDNPITKEGNIWILGEHRLMCGDSTNIEQVDRLMPETANMIFTDPPYLMGFEGNVHADGSKSFNAKHGGIKNDKMSEQEGNDFLDAINSVIKTKVDGAFYITFYRLGINRYFASLDRTGLQARSLIIWDKGNHTLSNSDYMSMYEPMFYGWVNNHKFYGGKNGMDIWRIKRTSKNNLHPTMKPVELVEKSLLDGSAVNGIVLDLFCGSGTTVIACQKHNRIARMMELDPKYCDVTIKRWQNFTGKDAVLESTGELYNSLK